MSNQFELHRSKIILLQQLLSVGLQDGLSSFSRFGRDGAQELRKHEMAMVQQARLHAGFVRNATERTIALLIEPNVFKRSARSRFGSKKVVPVIKIGHAQVGTAEGPYVTR